MSAVSSKSSPNSLRLRLAADIGGTFTDVAAFDEVSHQLLLGKSLSTPRAMVDGIERLESVRPLFACLCPPR